MSPQEDDAVRAAVEYIKVLQNEGYFATAYMVPIVLDGVRGIIVAVSSAQSTNVCKENHETHAARALITDPHWLHYDVWWFPGLAQLNLNGISSSMYQGQYRCSMQELLERHFAAKGMSNWRQLYCLMHRGYFHDSFRHLLLDHFGAKNWVEYTIGRSWRAYGGLDMYIAVKSAGMEPAEEDAWYLLNATGPWQNRGIASPEDWWRYATLVSFGQRPSVSEWYLELTGAIDITSRAQRRMGIMTRHVDPSGTAPALTAHAPQWMRGFVSDRARRDAVARR